jgi:hypothetical protein
LIPRLATASSLAFLLACASAHGLFGQAGVATGSIRGTVRDPGGAAVTSALAEVKNLDTGFERQASTDENGFFEAPLLRVGRYEVTVKAQGFAIYRQKGVAVELGRASDVSVRLALAVAEQSVTVDADATILTTSGSSVSGGLNLRSMENMPITSRNSFNLALLAPGFNGTRDNEFGNPAFAFGGMQRRAFLIDGIDNTQRGGPGRLGIFSPETLQEVKVISNSMAAEYGRTVGGIVSMVTRGGGNEYHGEALTLERRPGFIARQSLASSKPFQQWAVLSGNIGGPVKKDKLFFFASGEYEPLDAPRAITITPANAAALGIPDSDLGSAPFAQRFQTYLGRLDYQFNSRNSVYVRYSNFVTPSKFNTSGGLSPRSAGNNFDDRNDTFASQWASVISPKLVNEARFGFLRREFTRPPVSGAVGPVISISGVATLGSNTAANQYYNERQFNFIDTLSYRKGRHELKFGLDIDTIQVISGDRLMQTFTFANLQQYLNALKGTANYTQLTQEFGDNTASHTTNAFNFFAQDDFHLHSKLTLSYGLRYEYLAYPSLPADAPLPESRRIPNDPNNFAPRLGFAWQPASKTVVRGGYGLFYDTTNVRLISTAIRQNGARVLRYVVNGTAAGAPQFPNGLSASGLSFAPSKPSVTNFAGDFRSLSAHQANLQLERELAPDFSVTVGAQYYGGRRMPLLIDVNLGAPVSYLADGRPVFSNANRPNSNFNQILQLQSVANSTYYGGFVAINKRFAQSFQLTASYTLGWAFNQNDSTGDTGSSPSDSTHIRTDYGLSSSDQRHRFVLQGVLQPAIRSSGFAGKLVNGFLIAPNVTLTSGFPVSVTQGSDLNGDSVNNDRPLFRGRNDTPGYGFKEVNLRISRKFALNERLRLEIIGEAENLLNTTNASCSTGGCSGAVVSTFNAPDFRRITSTFNSRQIQLGGRLRF